MAQSHLLTCQLNFCLDIYSPWLTCHLLHFVNWLSLSFTTLPFKLVFKLVNSYSSIKTILTFLDRMVQVRSFSRKRLECRPCQICSSEYLWGEKSSAVHNRERFPRGPCLVVRIRVKDPRGSSPPRHQGHNWVHLVIGLHQLELISISFFCALFFFSHEGFHSKMNCFCFVF
jgi:hypothetical protein